VPHAERDFSDIGGTAGDENLERPAIPAFMRFGLKRFHFAHQFLAIERADARLVRDGEKDAHRPVRRSERLVFLDGSVARERFQRRGDHAQRIETQLDLRPGRAGLDFLVQTMQALLNFRRLQQRQGFIERGRLQV
jgi:hypothetical protein